MAPSREVTPTFWFADELMALAFAELRIDSLVHGDVQRCWALSKVCVCVCFIFLCLFLLFFLFVCLKQVNNQLLHWRNPFLEVPWAPWTHCSWFLHVMLSEWIQNQI